MTIKFLRGLQYTTNSPGANNAGYPLKFIYEFFGYCVNGGTSTSTPGGLAATTPTGGGLSINFTEGTSVVASGTDGYTAAGTITFVSNSASFNSSMIGKYLVTWISGSNSTEDSIYVIRGVPSATTLTLNILTGGTPDSSTLHPSLTTRSSIHYRVIDPQVAAGTVADGQFIVFQLNGSTLNSGQANSQIQIILRNTSQGTADFGLITSAAGTWTGSAFTDGSSEQREPENSQGIFNAGGPYGFITLIADPTFLLMHVKSRDSNNGSILHMEIPQRIYPQVSEPNLVTAMISGVSGLYTSGSGSNYGGGFVMMGQDAVSRNMRTLVPSLNGDGTGFGSNVFANVFGQNLNDARIGFNTIGSFIISSDGILSSPATAGQFNLARAKLRSVRFVGTFLPNYHRFGTNGQYLYLQNGIAWPWDNTILPYNLMQGGF